MRLFISPHSFLTEKLIARLDISVDSSSFSSLSFCFEQENERHQPTVTFKVLRRKFETNRSLHSPVSFGF